MKGRKFWKKHTNFIGRNFPWNELKHLILSKSRNCQSFTNTCILLTVPPCRIPSLHVLSLSLPTFLEAQGHAVAARPAAWTSSATPLPSPAPYDQASANQARSQESRKKEVLLRVHRPPTEPATINSSKSRHHAPVLMVRQRQLSQSPSPRLAPLWRLNQSLRPSPLRPVTTPWRRSRFERRRLPSSNYDMTLTPLRQKQNLIDNMGRRWTALRVHLY